MTNSDEEEKTVQSPEINLTKDIEIEEPAADDLVDEEEQTKKL